MKARSQVKRAPTAEAIAKKADRGGSVSAYFENTGHIVEPPTSVEVEFPADLLSRVDHEAAVLQVTRQVLINKLVRQALDRRRRVN